jgi:hypothetical protein
MYCGIYLPQGVVEIQQFPQNSNAIILNDATFAIAIEPVCIVVIAIQAAPLLRISNDALDSNAMRYFLIAALRLLSQLLVTAQHSKPQ